MQNQLITQMQVVWQMCFSKQQHFIDLFSVKPTVNGGLWFVWLLITKIWCVTVQCACWHYLWPSIDLSCNQHCKSITPLLTAFLFYISSSLFSVSWILYSCLFLLLIETWSWPDKLCNVPLSNSDKPLALYSSLVVTWPGLECTGQLLNGQPNSATFFMV